MKIYLMSAATYFFTMAITQAYAGSLTDKTIHICDDGAEWPPFTYYQRNNGERTNEIVGYSVDVIKDIFQKNGILFTIDLIPWKRCLLELELKGENYQLALSASYSEERNKKFIYSKPYYNSARHYFYSKTKYPKGLKINTTQDLNNYILGGIIGYNFESFGIKNSQITTRVGSFGQLIDMLHRSRIDLFLARYEILVGLSKIDPRITLDKSIGSAPLPELKKSPFHMLISKKYAFADELTKIINDGIARLKSAGELTRLRKRYLTVDGF